MLAKAISGRSKVAPRPKNTKRKTTKKREPVSSLDLVYSPFVLPTLDHSIPLVIKAGDSQLESAHFARLLVQAGVFNHEAISDNCKSVEQMVSEGLSAWFTKRLPSIDTMDLSFGVMSHTKAMKTLIPSESEDREIDSAVLYMTSGSCYSREMKDVAIGLELIVPGLFQTAYREVTASCSITVHFRDNEDLLNNFASRDWEADAYSIPSDEDARETMTEFMGMDNEYIDDNLPSNIVPYFGGNLCLPSLREKGFKFISDTALRELSASHPYEDVRNVALATLELRRAHKRAKKMGARLPNDRLEDQFPTFRAMSLVYQYDDFIGGIIDDEINYAFEVSEATEFEGWNILPKTVPELKEYFKKLAAAIDVLAKQDRLIKLISIP